MKKLSIKDFIQKTFKKYDKEVVDVKINTHKHDDYLTFETIAVLNDSTEKK